MHHHQHQQRPNQAFLRFWGRSTFPSAEEFEGGGGGRRRKRRREPEPPKPLEPLEPPAAPAEEPPAKLRAGPQDIAGLQTGSRLRFWDRDDRRVRNRDRQRVHRLALQRSAAAFYPAGPEWIARFDARFPDPSPDPRWPPIDGLPAAYTLYHRRRRDRERKRAGGRGAGGGGGAGAAGWRKDPPVDRATPVPAPGYLIRDRPPVTETAL